MRVRKIGITSLYLRNTNFGGQLQAYALCYRICGFGYDAEQICMNTKRRANSIKDKIWVASETSLLTLDLLKSIYRRWINDPRQYKNFKKFEAQIPHGPYLGNSKLIPKLNRRYGAFITGSDQIWNPDYYTDDGLRLQGLVFAAPEKRAISYAPSLGPDKAAIGRETVFREILERLDFISVREKTARDFLQPLTDKPIAVVVDPTMLLTRREWDELAAGPGREPPHLFAYFLREMDNRHDEQLHKIADALALPVRCIAEELERYPRPGAADRQILDAGPKEFLGEIRDAEMVFVNSFHGLVFSVLFHKPFWAFRRNREKDQGSMNSRITDFLAEFGLSDRLLEDGEVPSLEKLRTPIDYDRVDRILEEKRAFSLNWLKTALEGV